MVIKGERKEKKGINKCWCFYHRRDYEPVHIPIMANHDVVYGLVPSLSERWALWVARVYGIVL